MLLEAAALKVRKEDADAEAKAMKEAERQQKVQEARSELSKHRS